MMVIIEFESVFFFFCFANFTIDLSANWGQSSSWLSNRSIYHYPLRKWRQFLRIRLIEFPQAYNCLWHIIIPTENFPGKLSSTRTTGKSFSALLRLNLNRYRAQLELHLESTFHNPLTVITPRVHENRQELNSINFIPPCPDSILNNQNHSGTRHLKQFCGLLFSCAQRKSRSPKLLAALLNKKSH